MAFEIWYCNANSLQIDDIEFVNEFRCFFGTPITASASLFLNCMANYYSQFRTRYVIQNRFYVVTSSQ